MKKKIVSIILALVLVVSLQIPMAFAAASTLEIVLADGGYSAGDQIQATISGIANANIICVDYYLDGEKVATLTPSENSFSEAVSFGIATTEPQVLEARMIEENGTVTRTTENLAKRGTYENSLRDLEASATTDVSTLAAAGLTSYATSRSIELGDVSALDNVGSLEKCYAIAPTENGQINGFVLNLPATQKEGKLTFKFGVVSPHTASGTGTSTDNEIKYAISVNDATFVNTWEPNTDGKTLLYTNPISNNEDTYGKWYYSDTSTETGAWKLKQYYDIEVVVDLDRKTYSFSIMLNGVSMASANNIALPTNVRDGISSISLKTKTYKPNSKTDGTGQVYYTFVKYMKAIQEQATPDVEAITAGGISQTSLDASSNLITVNSFALGSADVNDTVTSNVNFGAGVTNDTIESTLSANNVTYVLGGAETPVIQTGAKKALGETTTPNTLYIKSGTSNASTPVFTFTPENEITSGIVDFGITYYGARTANSGSSTDSTYTYSTPEIWVVGKDAAGNPVNRKLIYRSSSSSYYLSWEHKNGDSIVTSNGNADSYTAYRLYNWKVSINLDNGTYSFAVVDMANNTTPQNTSASNLTLPDDLAEITAIKFSHKMQKSTSSTPVNLEIRDFSLTNKKSYIEGLESTLSVAGDAATFTFGETPAAGNWYNLYLGGTKAKVKFAPASFQVEEHTKVTVAGADKVITLFKNTENTAKSAVVLSAQNGLIQSVNLLNDSIAANSEKAVITALPAGGKVMVWDGLTKLVPLMPAAE